LAKKDQIEQGIVKYRQMVRIRKFEDKICEDYAKGLIPGLAHLYIGEEAVAVGVCSALNSDDFITSTHRGHGHCVAKGGDIPQMMAEIYGRTTGYCKGKGGSMHIADIDIGILGANGIVGAGIPIAVGAALSGKMRKSGQVAVAFFGDGATNQGTFHEGLNMASIWDLPVVFVCENNLYGLGTNQAKHQNITDISIRATSYGMPGVIVDGNDVDAVYEAAMEAVERARKGEGPTLIECKTYRWRGHHEGDANQGAKYRTKEEIEAWKKRCPILRFEKKLLKAGVKAADLKKIQEEVQSEIDAAVDFSLSCTLPTLEDVLCDVYCDADEVREESR
jgi:acetoin:2,6-dichlorophenolindophenol oxidoreductase subunit alpha